MTGKDGDDPATQIAALQDALSGALRELAVLRAIEDIKQLKYRYFRAMDRADMALLRSVLAEDFHFDLSGSAWSMKGSDREDFIERMRLNFNSDMATQHHGHHPEITIDADGRSAGGVWYLQDIVHDGAQGSLLFGTNFYDDRYIRTAEGWRIASSRWTRHIEVRQNLPAPLLYNDRYLAHHGHKITR